MSAAILVPKVKDGPSVKRANIVFALGEESQDELRDALASWHVETKLTNAKLLARTVERGAQGSPLIGFQTEVRHQHSVELRS